MRYRKQIPVLFLTLMLAGTAMADMPKRISGFDEIVKPSLQVSGHYVAGFMRPGSAQQPSPAQMSVWLDGRHDRLCVSARTVDGYYEAIAEYDISASTQGLYPLDFSAGQRDVFREYGPHELVLRGRVGADCTRPEALSEVPMAWIRADRLPATYILYVNTDGLDAEIVFPEPGNPRAVMRFPCSSVTTRFKRRIYDASCVIDTDSKIDGAAARIEFSRYGEDEGWKPLSLLFPGDR